MIDTDADVGEGVTEDVGGEVGIIHPAFEDGAGTETGGAVVEPLAEIGPYRIPIIRQNGVAAAAVRPGLGEAFCAFVGTDPRQSAERRVQGKGVQGFFGAFAVDAVQKRIFQRTDMIP